jgi:hypothetical protein
MGSSFSGAGIGSGSGGIRGGGIGHVAVHDGAMRSFDTSDEKAWAELQGLLTRISSEYFGFIRTNQTVTTAYEALHRLSVQLVLNGSWSGIETEYGVDGADGCLLRLARRLSDAAHPRIRAILNSALLEFFTAMCHGNGAFLGRDGGSILPNIDGAVFQSTSNIFLANFLAGVLRTQYKTLSKDARKQLGQFARQKADQIVAAFASEFRGKPWKEIPQVSYSHLMRVLFQEQDWLETRLRRKLLPDPIASAA